MKKIFIIAFASLLLITLASAQPVKKIQTPEALEQSLEFNFFGAFVGITDLKIVMPITKLGSRGLKTYAIGGLFIDYAWGKHSRKVNEYGKVKFIGGKLGVRQFFWRGLHIDVNVNVGYRHEEHNILDNTTLNSRTSRLFTQVGWQGDLGRSLYYRLSGGMGQHLFRIGDKYAYTERKTIPFADICIGVKF